MSGLGRQTGWSTIASRGLVFAFLWWMFTDGSPESWWIGGPAVVAAVVVSMVLLPRATMVWMAGLRFAPMFLWLSLKGGLDVARRAFHPRMPIDPTLIEYPLRLPRGMPRVMLANICSLLPGTLSADLEGEVLKVHVLDSSGAASSELGALEQSVARICGVSLAA